MCKKLTEQYGLYIARGKGAIKERRLRSMDAIRYQMLHRVSESLQVSRNWKEFESELSKQESVCASDIILRQTV